jgi:hypothetical protein
VANDDEVVRDPEMADIPIDPLANDTDPDGDGLFVVLDGTPAGGDVAVATDGTLVYTPGPDFTGSDSFTYRASDVFTESGPATVVIRSDRASCGPPPCPDGEVCFAQACFAQCDETEQCGNGESCYDDRCAVSACEGVECTDGEVCYGGACFESCDDDTCSSGQCYDGRCARDPCDDVTCAVGSICVGGGCFEACDDDGECSGENSCIDGRCAANACDGIQCATGQTCVGGACFDSCSVDDDCGAGEVCDDGACRMPAECQSDDCVDGGCCATVEAPAVDRLPTLIVALLLWVGWRRRD